MKPTTITLRTVARCLSVTLAGVCIAFAATSEASERDFGSTHVQRVTSIYDGDTFRVDIAGWPAIVGSRVPIRVAGAETPEMRARCKSEKRLALEAKQFTVSALRNAHDIEPRHMKRGKYFRIVAQV